MPTTNINPATDLNPEPSPIDIRAGTCDRAELVIMRAVSQGWVTVHDRKQLKDTIRIALDTEVRAGGPYFDKTNT